ncbi:MAG: hypothetical protein ACI3YT_11335 [Prevotella sp.]
MTTRTGEDFGETAISGDKDFGETVILMLENSGGMKGNRIFAPEIKLLASMKRVFPDMTLSMRHPLFDSLSDVSKSGMTARCFFLSLQYPNGLGIICQEP